MFTQRDSESWGSFSCLPQLLAPISAGVQRESPYLQWQNNSASSSQTITKWSVKDPVLSSLLQVGIPRNRPVRGQNKKCWICCSRGFLPRLPDRCLPPSLDTRTDVCLSANSHDTKETETRCRTGNYDSPSMSQTVLVFESDRSLSPPITLLALPDIV